MLNLHMTQSTMGWAALTVFIVAYLMVITEEFTTLRKSKPVVLAAGIIWILVAILAQSLQLGVETQNALKHQILDYAELFLFLLVAMTYVNAIEERGVFHALKNWLIQKNLSYRALFWITGILAFFISPIADNMTTALVMCAVILAVGKDQPRFIALSCINVVVAANAGGAFSPFGDITTLMVWQKGILGFTQFFVLFIPCVINFVVPAMLMHFAIPALKPTGSENHTPIARGGFFIIGLFLLTIASTVSMHHFLLIPPAAGMMLGFALLQFYGYYLRKRDKFDIFDHIKRVEWDTLLFFYGIILCVGGLATIGFLGIASDIMYMQWGATSANITLGLLSAIIDNIPLMFAVLTMHPEMSTGQWLLITLTTGVGGSLLSIGSAAGVALMGQSKGQYTFLSHLKWTWAIALGYFAAIFAHFVINKGLF